MERDFYTDEFEQLIKEKADQFRMYPSKRVWHSIYNNLHPSRRWPSFVISILFFTSLVSIGYLNTGDNTQTNLLAGKKAGSSSIQLSDEITPSATQQNVPNTALKNEELNGSVPMAVASLSEKTDPFNSSSETVASNSIAGTKGLASKKTNHQYHSITTNRSKRTTKARINNPLPDESFAIATKTAELKPAAPVSQVLGSEAISGLATVEKLLQPSNETMFGLTESEIANGQGLDEQPNEKKAADAKSLSKTEQANTAVENEKSWIENFAFQHKPARAAWKDRLELEFYATPAVNYRKLSPGADGYSNPNPFTTGDINKAISQKPGLGIETGVGLTYAFAKNLRLNAGIQFNYTNYNVNADQTGHPTLTSILITDPATGYAYPSQRTSTIANAYDGNALRPITLHNRTYQVSIPVGLAYKLSSNRNVEWFAGATVQPSYIFGGNAHLISSDLKNYVSDPSSIRHWNLNIGLETFMNYKLGKYSLRVGPQFRYQVYSTYRKDIALIEKPYAVGLKFGIVKGF